MIFGFFSKMTRQFWAFACTNIAPSKVSSSCLRTFRLAPSKVSSSCLRTFRLESLTGRCRYKTQTLAGRLFEKQFIACNFKVTICVAPCRLMRRVGEVVAHGGSTVSQIYHCRVFHLLCTQHYTSMCMNPRYSGKRNWRHRNGNQWYIHPSLKNKHTEATCKNNMTFLVNEACLRRIYFAVVG